MDERQGQCTIAWKFHCKQCLKVTTYDSSKGHRIAQTVAMRWAREDGWSKGKEGWRCPACSPQKGTTDGKV